MNLNLKASSPRSLDPKGFMTALLLLATLLATSTAAADCHVERRLYPSHRVYFNVNDISSIYERIIEDCLRNDCEGMIKNVAQKGGDMMHVELDLMYKVEGSSGSVADAVSSLGRMAETDESLQQASTSFTSFYKEVTVSCADATVLTVIATPRSVFGF